MRRLYLALAALILMTVTAAAAPISVAPACRADGTRVALLIGNQAYTGSMQALENPRHDTEVFKDLLCRNGFTVYRYSDLAIDEFDQAISAFSMASQDAKTVVVYYSGHGFAAGRKNWLVPTDAEISCEDMVDGTASPRMTRRLVDLDEQVVGRLNDQADQIIILDACRTSPIKGCRGGSSPTFAKGLSPSQGSSGRLIVYATQDGQAALDSLPNSTNSPLMTALADRLPKHPKLDWVAAMLDVSSDVAKLTHQRQLPNLDVSLPPQGCLAADCLVDVPKQPDTTVALKAFIASLGDRAVLQGLLTYPDASVQLAARSRLAALQPIPAPAVADPAPVDSSPEPPPLAPPGVPQRAGLLVDAPDEPGKVKTYQGSVVWRSDSVNEGQGQPLANAVSAEIEIPEAKVLLSMVIKKNYEPQFPASHTIEFHFAEQTGNTLGPVKQIGVPDMRKDDAAAKGDPLIGVPVAITDDYFLVGLSRGAAEQTNEAQLAQRNWMDLSLRLSSGKIAKITFEKGPTGQKIIHDAIASWNQAIKTAKLAPITSSGQFATALPMDSSTLRRASDPFCCQASKTVTDNYKGVVFGKLGRSQHAVEEAQAKHLRGVVTVSFSVDDRGQVADLKIIHSSGNPAVDDLAQQMVREASPFPPPPPNMLRVFTPVLTFGNG